MLSKEKLHQEKKASPKTILELIALHDAWKRTFREGAMGNHDAYNLARDTRHHFEEELWIPVKGLVAELPKIAKRIDEEFIGCSAGLAQFLEEALFLLGAKEAQK